MIERPSHRVLTPPRRAARPTLQALPLIGVALLSGATGPSQAALRGATDWAAVGAVFAEYQRSDAPGCGLGVVRESVLVYGRGYGMANLDHGIAITPQTVFRTGSVGKQFTAAAVAIAAREGAISLDDPVRRWITELPRYPVDPTVRHLVHHTSGVRDYLTLMALRGLRNDDYYTNADVRAAIARQRELNFTPGSDYLYSNSGYFLLGEVIRESTGMSLREYADAKIFAPLGMTHSHFHDDHRHIVPMRATGYAPTDDGFRISVTTLDMVGDGGVFTSVEDLALWVDALNHDRLGVNDLLESTVPLTTGEPNAYAFGQNLGTYRGARTASHGGSFVGYRAAIVRFPAQDVSIALACNRADARPSEWALRVADVVLADELDAQVATQSDARPTMTDPPPPGPVDDAASFVGVYHSDELDVEYRLFLDGGTLRLRAGADIDTEIHQIADDHLVGRGGMELRVQRDDGRVTGFLLDSGRVRNLRFVRTGDGTA